MKFVSTYTSIPVPKVLSWNSDANNPVGAEYMIMQKVGVKLADCSIHLLIKPFR